MIMNQLKDATDHRCRCGTAPFATLIGNQDCAKEQHETELAWRLSGADDAIPR
jgi:hypothetical protein